MKHSKNKFTASPIIEFYLGIGKDSRIFKIHRKRAKRLLEIFMNDPSIQIIKQIYKKEQYYGNIKK